MSWRVLSALCVSLSFAVPVGSQELTLPQAQADFRMMQGALEAIHAGLYRYATPAQIDGAFRAQRVQLDHAMTAKELYALLYETLAPIRCGHTWIRWDEHGAMQSAFSAAKQFPLGMMIENRSLKVLRNNTADDRSIRPGMEILSINGLSAGDIIERVRPQIRADGDGQSGQRANLQENFARLYWIFIGDPGEFFVEARTQAGETIKARLPGVTDAQRDRNHNPVNAAMQASLDKLTWWHGNLGLRFLEEPGIAQIRIGEFVGEDYSAWIESTFKTLREKGTKTLIVDLRGNGGGTDLYGALLVSYLGEEPFRYFDRIWMKTTQPPFREFSDWKTLDSQEDVDDGVDKRKLLNGEGVVPDVADGFLLTGKMHAGLYEQPPGKYPFRGKVFVLIDGGTFSTAADFSAVTRHLKRAAFIGEETGGAYYGNNSGMRFLLTLPNSGFKVSIPMYEYWNAVSGGDARRGVLPDYPVATTVQDLLRGADRQLELALHLARQGHDAP